jgi:integrase
MTRGGLFRLQVADLPKLAAGFYADGGNLYLAVERNKNGDGFNRRWIFRYQLPGGGRQRDMGLGSVTDHGANANGLSSVRELAQNARQMLARGLDPIEDRKRQIAERAAAIPVPTFEKVTKDYLAAHDADWKPRVLSHWRMTLEEYAKPLHKLPVNLIDTDHVLKCIEPIWKEKNSTASRVRSRVEAVLNFASVKKYRSGANPARWRGHLDHLLGKPSKIAPTENFAAMDYRDMPAFMAELRGRKVTISNLALEFLILCCARTDEVLKATWREIDLDESRWMIPGGRMKASKPHDVPLSARAVEILKAAREINSKLGAKSDYLFVSGRNGAHLSSNALLALLKRRLGRVDCTIHGMRACFKTWCSEETNFPNELSEMQLAHTVGNKVEQAYRRGTGFKKRIALADAWASYCSKPRRADGKVLTFKRQ